MLSRAATIVLLVASVVHSESVLTATSFDLSFDIVGVHSSSWFALPATPLFNSFAGASNTVVSLSLRHRQEAAPRLANALEAQLTRTSIMRSFFNCEQAGSSSTPPALANNITWEVDSDLEEVILMPFSLSSSATSALCTTTPYPNSKPVFGTASPPYSATTTQPAANDSTSTDLPLSAGLASSVSVPTILAILNDITDDAASTRLHCLSVLATFMRRKQFIDSVPPRFGAEKTSTRPFLTGVNQSRSAPPTKATVVYGHF
ncbi:hypothetical protein EIP91_001005 [Steccherinum ochraceum]|uniref:Uncharacterized protein n=1 Tax=Steccherinum ochraceum TaxID=92696 RepID=A0A4R0RHX1_9APHY|nr:hypothetical protein EIP91_001005 [Steccherinum ochraceum]